MDFSKITDFMKKYPKLDDLGTETDGFESKLWILLKLHEGNLTQTELASTRCKSLRDQCPEFEDLMSILEILHSQQLIWKQAVEGEIVWRIKDTVAFEITKFKQDIEQQAYQKGQHLSEFIKNCVKDPYISPKLLEESQKIAWKDFFRKILSESAIGTINIAFSLVFRN